MRWMAWSGDGRLEESFRRSDAGDRAAGGVGDFGAVAVGEFPALVSGGSRRVQRGEARALRGKATVRRRETGAARRGERIDLDRFVCGRGVLVHEAHYRSI